MEQALLDELKNLGLKEISNLGVIKSDMWIRFGATYSLASRTSGDVSLEYRRIQRRKKMVEKVKAGDKAPNGLTYKICPLCDGFHTKIFTCTICRMKGCAKCIKRNHRGLYICSSCRGV